MQSQAGSGMNLWDQVKTGTRVSHPFQQKGPWRKTSRDQASGREQGDGQAGGAETHTSPGEQAVSFRLLFFFFFFFFSFSQSF